MPDAWRIYASLAGEHMQARVFAWRVMWQSNRRRCDYSCVDRAMCVRCRVMRVDRAMLLRVCCQWFEVCRHMIGNRSATGMSIMISTLRRLSHPLYIIDPSVRKYVILQTRNIAHKRRRIHAYGATT